MTKDQGPKILFFKYFSTSFNEKFNNLYKNEKFYWLKKLNAFEKFEIDKNKKVIKENKTLLKKKTL